MLVDKLYNLNVTFEIVNDNKNSSIAYAIKNKKGQVISCNQKFLDCTGVDDIKLLQGLSDKDINLWKDNIYDYAIGEKISICSQGYYLSTEYLPIQNGTDIKTILTEKIPFYDQDRKNYILVRFKILENNELVNCKAYTLNDISIVEFDYYFEKLKFTSKEYRILKYLIEHNLEYRQIAKIMSYTTSSIKACIQNIYNNLDILSKEYRKIIFLRSLLKYMFLPESNKEISKNIRF
ncbi:helix-turn-helix transcriptional regulator [Francisella tularensis]|uniref:helix-turn-helix transcriptional regulator n=1 Tax=Francisella tularensis TaxID=263 RepID=UPI001C0F2A45|nr:hypothetical protein [Francisella tularensis]MBK2108934.1 hypothetical protein [Francisella tularensis subsp. novicida FSC595]